MFFHPLVVSNSWPDITRTNSEFRVSPGEYLLTDRTYDKLLVRLAEKRFQGVTPELRKNMLSFYAQMKTPDRHGIGPQLASLKAFSEPARRP